MIGYWKAKLGGQEISRITGKIGLGVQNEVRQKANRVLSRKHASHSKDPFTTQEATLQMDITRWSILRSDLLFSL